MTWDLQRLVITVVILGYFGYALVFRYTNGIEEVLKSIVMLAVGYWLAKNDSQERATENTGKAFEAVTKALDSQPTNSTGNVEMSANNVEVTER